MWQTVTHLPGSCGKPKLPPHIQEEKRRGRGQGLPVSHTDPLAKPPQIPPYSPTPQFLCVSSWKLSSFLMHGLRQCRVNGWGDTTHIIQNPSHRTSLKMTTNLNHVLNAVLLVICAVDNQVSQESTFSHCLPPLPLPFATWGSTSVGSNISRLWQSSLLSNEKNARLRALNK